MFWRSLFRSFLVFSRLNSVLWVLSLCFALLVSSPLVSQQSKLPCPSDLPSALWQSKFPFDLVYPVDSSPLVPDNSCISFAFWGFEKEMCSLSMLIPVIKNVFLFRLVIQVIVNL